MLRRLLFAAWLCLTNSLAIAEDVVSMAIGVHGVREIVDIHSGSSIWTSLRSSCSNSKRCSLTAGSEISCRARRIHGSSSSVGSGSCVSATG